MSQKIVFCIYFILLNVLFENAYSQNIDTTSSSDSKKVEISKTIKEMVERHYINQDTLKDENHLIEQDKQSAEIDTSMSSSIQKTVVNSSQDSIKIIPQIIINDDEFYTKTQEVRLKIVAPNAIGIQLNNSEIFPTDNWISITPLLDWKLPEEDGMKRVYLRVLYPDSSISPVYYDEIILNKTPPVAKFTIIPDTGIAGETHFTFNASESHANFDLFLRWDWEDDGTFDTPWDTSKEIVYTYAKGGGKKKVTLEVKDNSGWVISTTGEVVVFSRPQAKFVFVQNFQNPLLISFDASPTHDDDVGEKLEMRWNFNADSLWDTDWSANKSVIHNFDNFKKQQVCLQVKDSHGLLSMIEETIINKFYNMDFIPAGDFMMGCDSFDVDERPVHTVFVYDFWIDKYPVTNQEYANFLNYQKDKSEEISKFINLDSPDTKIRLIDSNYSVEKGFEQHPVVQVSWYGAQAYAKFCCKSLPTEAEWEKAARGDTGRLYPWGNELSGDRANFWDSGDPFDNNTTPVGFFDGRNFNGFQTLNSPSPYGIYDLVDNVREWCNDWYQHNYYQETPFQNPTGPVTGSKRVVRGGGYLFRNETLRSTFRSSYNPASTISYIGFRCVIRE